MENKTSKYFKYAIGEIILVVIGILIALQINNWNNEASKKNEGLAFLQRILPEIKSNKLEVDKQLRIEWKQRESSKQIINMFGKGDDELVAKKLDSLIYNILLGNYLDLTTSTMDEGFNAGQVALINSEKIRTSLYQIKAEFSEAKQTIIKGNIDMRNNLLPYLYENHNWRRMDYYYSQNKDELGSSYFDSKSKTLLSSLKFENLIDNRFWASDNQFRKLEELKTELSNLEELITRHIELKND